MKETDSHQFLHFSSCHPYHTKKGIPYGQALRIRRICSEDNCFESRVSDLKRWLLSRAHKEDVINSQIDKARRFDRDALLSDVNQRVNDPNKIYLVVTYHPALSKKLYDILRDNHNILHTDEEHRRVFSEVPMVSFRRAKTIKDVLVRSKLKTVDFQPGSCNKCNRSNCDVDSLLDDSNTFTNAEGDRVFHLRKGFLNCKSKFVVYKLRCRTCGLQYVGSTITQFNLRINNYKSQFKKYVERKENGHPNPGHKIAQAGLFEHFCSLGHHKKDDWSFQIIDQADTVQRLRECESFWQHKLNCFIPHGLNKREVPTDT